MVSLKHYLNVVVKVMLCTSEVPAVTAPAKPSRWLRSAVIRCLVLLHSLLMPNLGHAQSAPPVGRPILFVHGWCGQATDWGVIQQSTIQYLQGLQPSLYSRSANYDVYYDGQTVRTWPDGGDFLSTVPSNARFFSINFYDFLSGADPSFFNPVRTINVADVSILNKADELAQVIGAITSLTHVKDVVVIAHSMGGLVARAYIENQGVPYTSAVCSDTEFPEYASCAHATNTQFAQDIAKLITLDTPQAGAGIANLINDYSGLVSALWRACQGTDTLNRRELATSSWVISALSNNVVTASSDVTTAAIKSYTIPGLYIPGVISANPPNDGIITDQEQSIHKVAPGVTSYYDVENFVGSSTATGCLLHVLDCLGLQPTTAPAVYAQAGMGVNGQVSSITVQATLNFAPWSGSVNYVLGGPVGLSGNSVPNTFYDVPLGTYTLTYLSGGPSSNIDQSPIVLYVGSDHTYGFNNWNSTMTLSFTSSAPSSPSVTTGSATNVGPNSATLTGTVNPNGSPGSYWFEWSTDSSLTTHNITAVQSAGSGTAPVNVTSNLSGLVPNKPYYYRLAAAGTGGPFVKGSVLSFYTSTEVVLPAPTLLVPSDNATSVFAATFSWSPVANASSYRLIVATNVGALPTDPTSSSCGSGCVLNATATGTSYVALTGVLAPGTTYYWEVHARSAAQYGAWSQAFRFATAPSYGQAIINTIAGGGLPDNVSALLAPLGAAQGIAFDAAGNYYVSVLNAIFRIDLNGIITHVAGTGQAGFSGDNGPAQLAQLSNPQGLAVDTLGNLYIADLGNNRVRKILLSSGTITTAAAVTNPESVAVGPDGSVYVGVACFQVVRIAAGTGAVTVVAGGVSGFGGDGGLAVNAAMGGILGLAISGSNLFLADSENQRIRKVSLDTGIISTVVGGGAARGDGGPGTAAQLLYPLSLSVGPSGALYIADWEDGRIRQWVPATGIITTVAGGGSGSADGILATAATLFAPEALAVNSAGDLYFEANSIIERVSLSTGLINKAAGNGSCASFFGDGGQATKAMLSPPNSVAADQNGTLFILDEGNGRVRSVDLATGTINTVAGNGLQYWFFPGGDGQTATGTSLNVVDFNSAVMADGGGSLYVADGQSRIRRVDLNTGLIWTAAGGGSSTADGVLATDAKLSPSTLALDGSGNLLFIDGSRIRKMDQNSGLVSTLAGTGAAGFSGDGGPAVLATFSSPSALALDPAGNVYIADTGNQRIRMITTGDGHISTIAGTGTGGFSGDGGLAAGASLNLSWPTGLAVDFGNHLLISDTSNNRIRSIDLGTGLISTVVGNGNKGFGGDGTLATLASLNGPGGISFDSQGNLYIADSGNNRIRVITNASHPYTACAELATTATSFGSSSSTGIVNVAAPATCGWTARSNSSWITITSGQSGNGSGVVSYSIAANIGTATRTGTLALQRQNLTITQTGMPNVAPTADSVAPSSGISSGGLFTFTYSDQNGYLDIKNVGASFSSLSGGPPYSCYLYADPDSTSLWLLMDDGVSWAGPSAAGWSTLENSSCIVNGPATGFSRSGTHVTFVLNAAFKPGFVGWATIYGGAWDFSGLGNYVSLGSWGIPGNSCAITLGAGSQNIPATGGSWTVSVTNTIPVVGGCTWTATSNVAWITISAGTTGTGNGSVSYSVAANTAGTARNGTLTIAGQVYNITQAAGPELAITKTHVGVFTQAQNGTYTVTVRNGNFAGPTSGVVTVTETVPSGLTLVSMAGSGWTCPGTAVNNCTRSDTLAAGASFPAITVTVNVAANAASPLANSVSVSGGGSATANITDSTVITAIGPQALRFVPITPCRIADTRNPAGPFGGPSITGGTSRDFTIPNSACGVPSGAQAYSLNVAVVPAGPLGFLTLWPT